MAKLTILQMLQAAMGEVGMPAPASAVAAADTLAVQLLALANREVRECMKMINGASGWQQLRKEWVFSSVPTQETYTLPSDWAHMCDSTFWDRTLRWQCIGPLSPQEWQTLRSGVLQAGPRRRFRFLGGALHLDPVPADTNTLALEYYSSTPVLAADGTAKERFTADADTYLLPDDIMILGVKWRWKHAKGLDYTQDYKAWDDACRRELGIDASSRVLRLDVVQPDVTLLGSLNIPDTGYGR